MVVIRVAPISFILANFITYKQVLIKCYLSKDLSYFQNLSKWIRTGRKNVTKIVKNTRKIAGL